MKITLLLTGKTEDPHISEGVDRYLRMIRAYASTEVIIIPVKNKWNALPPAIRMEHEGKLILQYFASHDFTVLLDEKGVGLTSEGFARFLQERMNRSARALLFVVGGPWGFSKEVKNRADMLLSLSPMTFTHQMIRLIFTEQLYRAFTIINNHPYHN
ncbi:MAG: 23S rRNA (pseudouridine(1915)-N(3))-methyltransferase RlmH [Bacteroidales bacterium]|nr:23S rRNA (pseudouridine(1915)-N(3))-methyltransferase RlmH [Bacteroidales bacterium]